MDCTLRELLDIPKLRELLDSLNEIQGMPCAVIDLEGNILTATVWQDICTKFHRVNPATEQTCIESNRNIGACFDTAKPHTIYRCPLGLVNSAVPIVIEGKNFGNIHTGQIFTSPPDEAYFIAQARRYGFDESEYLSAMRKVPLIPEKQLKKNLTFFSKLAQMLAEQGLRAIRQIETNRALQKSEDRHRTILQMAISGICLTDLQGGLLEVNKAYCQLTGYSEQELLQMSIFDLEAGEPAAATAARLRKIKELGEAVFESRHRRKDGTVIDVEISVQYRPDDGGQLMAFVRDITERKRTAKSLQESEERWKFALEGTGDGLWDWDVVTGHVYFSRQWKAMFGYADEEIGDSLDEWDRRVHPDDKSAVHADIERHFRGETETYVSEHRLLCRDGTYKWTLDRGKVIQWTEEGSPRRVIGIQTDISGRKRAEEYRSMGQDILLAMNEEETQQTAIRRVIGLVKSITGVEAVGIRLQDEDDFPYICQEGFPRDFLQKESSLLVRNQNGGICRDDCGAVCLECTCGLVITGKTDPSNPNFTSGGSAWTSDSGQVLQELAHADLRLNPRDECLHQGFASVALIPIRAKGRIVGLLQLNDHRKGLFTLREIEILEDIAENIGEAMLRKQAEEKLIASERFLRTLTDHLPGMVSYWTDELRCSFANRAYLDWFGKTPEQIMGIGVQELLGEELFRKNEPYLLGVLQGEPQHFERTLVKPDGETCYTWSHYIPDLVDGIARGIIVLISDVTELKRAEEENSKLQAQLHQAQKIEAVGRLAGGVAHDFNNMLSVIVGHAEMSLMRIDPSHPIYFPLKEISKAAERSAVLTRQLLAFARKQAVAPKVVNLNEALAGMLNMLQRLIGENIHLTWRPAVKLWQIMMDTSQIDQILANLCVNSRDAIADIGEVIIETGNCSIDAHYNKAHSYALPGDYVKIVVSDSGSGMDKKTLDHIFEPFFTTKGVGEGTGLGLATVYGIVRQNNGFINVYSEPGRGTTFTVYLPRYEGETGQHQKEVAADSFHKGHETILLVEDEPAILEMTEMILTELGYTVLKAGTPSAAIRLANEHSGDIHLLMTDVIMPEMNGRELARNLLSSYPQISCLFMSGYTADIIAHHGVLEDGVHFIQKPFQVTVLADKLREVLDS